MCNTVMGVNNMVEGVIGTGHHSRNFFCSSGRTVELILRIKLIVCDHIMLLILKLLLICFVWEQQLRLEIWLLQTHTIL